MSHFETLWEEAEKLLQEETSASSWEELIREATIKLATMEKLNQLSSEEDSVKFKSHMVGKLLLVFTQLSAKAGINVYAALKTAMDDRKISIFEEKYK